MSAVLMQQLDTVLLLVIVVSGLIIGAEDRQISWPCRLLVVLGAFACFSHAAWLNGYWSPSAAGYPWAGLIRDGSFAGLGALRAFTVLRAGYAERAEMRRRIGGAKFQYGNVVTRPDRSRR